MKTTTTFNAKERTIIFSFIVFFITIASMTTENPWLHRSYELALLIALFITEINFRKTFRTMHEINGAMLALIWEIQKIKESFNEKSRFEKNGNL